MGVHKKVKNNCLICGEKLKLNNLNLRDDIAKNDQKYSDVFKSWKNDCTETICKILFGLDKHPFLNYFQNAEYCSDCLNSLRELNLISKQLQGLKSKQVKLSNQIWQLLDKNYNSIKPKSDENILQGRISLFTENYNLAVSLLETYNQNEMLEIIYTVTSQPYLMSPNYKISGGIAEYSHSSVKSQEQNLKLEKDNSTNDATYYYVVPDPENKSSTVNESSTVLNDYNSENATNDSLYSMYEMEDDEAHCPDIPLADESENTNETKIKTIENGNSGPTTITQFRLYCYICKHVFHSRIDLKRHNRQNHKAQVTCTTCGKCFLSDAGLRDHYAVSHGDPSLLHKCTHCEKVFRQKSAFNAHMLSHTNEMRFTCSTCGKGFKHKRGYEQHKLLHGNKRLDCPLCDRKYVSTIVLQRHIKTNHSENNKNVKTVKPDILDYNCKYCGVRYNTEEELNGHYSIAHLGQNPFSCASCPEIFSSSVLLKKHMKLVHPSAEDTSNALHCHVCDKIYYSRFNLNNHKKLHEDPDLLPKCSICGIVVLSQRSLARHMDTHNTELSYTCETCGKSFNSSRRLKTHANWHKETKPFKCSVCGKTFINSQVLMRHEVSHTDIKDFTCHTCGKAFNLQGNLAQHEKIHRKIGNEPVRKRKKKEQVETWYGGDDMVGTF